MDLDIANYIYTNGKGYNAKGIPKMLLYEEIFGFVTLNYVYTF